MNPGCYVGCTPPVVGHPVVVSPVVPHFVPAIHVASTLPFTGLDVGELLALGLGLIVTAVVLTFRLKKDEA